MTAGFATTVEAGVYKEGVMNIIGIHDGHNAAVALIRDGEIVHALQEERVSRVKNQHGFPKGILETSHGGFAGTRK